METDAELKKASQLEFQLIMLKLERAQLQRLKRESKAPAAERDEALRGRPVRREGPQRARDGGGDDRQDAESGHRKRHGAGTRGLGGRSRRFHPRCPKAFDRCSEEEPVLRDLGNGRQVSCHLYDD